MDRTHTRAALHRLNSAVLDSLIQKFASGEATSEDIANAVDWLANNGVHRGGRNDPFQYDDGSGGDESGEVVYLDDGP